MSVMKIWAVTEVTFKCNHITMNLTYESLSLIYLFSLSHLMFIYGNQTVAIVVAMHDEN